MSLFKSANKTVRTQGNHQFNKDAVDRFVWWIVERHNIHIKRFVRNLPGPWSDDEVMQTQFFTNPYRENDKTTIWFRENVRDPLAAYREVVAATILFRWFNWIPTGEILCGHHGYGLSSKELSASELAVVKREKGTPVDHYLVWKPNRVGRILSHVAAEGTKVFTGAYIIKLENGKSKIKSVCDIFTEHVWKRRRKLFGEMFPNGKVATMERAHKVLSQIPYLGGFMAYEVVCDLRYTSFLQNAPDINTWCHMGPGARRGLRRLLGLSVEDRNAKSLPFSDRAAMVVLGELLDHVNNKLPNRLGKLEVPRFEMREIEHSLCEFDKYERARTGIGGQMKRRGPKGALPR